MEKELLKLLLEKANESGIDKVLITIHKEKMLHQEQLQK